VLFANSGRYQRRLCATEFKTCVSKGYSTLVRFRTAMHLRGRADAAGAFVLNIGDIRGRWKFGLGWVYVGSDSSRRFKRLGPFFCFRSSRKEAY